jgi:hypothetical protein
MPPPDAGRWREARGPARWVKFPPRLAYFDVDGPIRGGDAKHQDPDCAGCAAAIMRTSQLEGSPPAEQHPSESRRMCQEGHAIARRVVMLVAFVVGVRLLARVQR